MPPSSLLSSSASSSLLSSSSPRGMTGMSWRRVPPLASASASRRATRSRRLPRVAPTVVQGDDDRREARELLPVASPSVSAELPLCKSPSAASLACHSCFCSNDTSRRSAATAVASFSLPRSPKRAARAGGVPTAAARVARRVGVGEMMVSRRSVADGARASHEWSSSSAAVARAEGVLRKPWRRKCSSASDKPQPTSGGWSSCRMRTCTANALRPAYGGAPDRMATTVHMRAQMSAGNETSAVLSRNSGAM
mmetsp:Transcript_5946/g.19416  ORF Transcript_5946/g.19416 Transcript_5946/m.19416 type:complete len:252 (-) Transcript_5946:475-1230(-)